MVLPHVQILVMHEELQVRLIAVVVPADHGFTISRIHVYSIDGDTGSTETIWDNYCHLVSDTTIRPPDLCVYFHSIILYHRHAAGHWCSLVRPTECDAVGSIVYLEYLTFYSVYNAGYVTG